MNASAVLLAMAPEHLLLAGIVALLVLEIFSERPNAALPLAVAFVAAAAGAAAWLGFTGYVGAPFPGQFDLTPPASFAKALVLALAVPVLLFSKEDFGRGEFYPLILSSLYGICLLASAESFLTLFLGIELMSIPVYVLVLLGYRRPESAEAASSTWSSPARRAPRSSWAPRSCTAPPGPSRSRASRSPSARRACWPARPS